MHKARIVQFRQVSTNQPTQIKGYSSRIDAWLASIDLPAAVAASRHLMAFTFLSFRYGFQSKNKTY